MATDGIRFTGTIKSGKHAGTVVESDLTDEQAADLLRNGKSDFGRELAKHAGRSSMTPGRRVWLHKLALEARDRKDAPRREQPAGIEAAKLDSMFAFARESGKLQKPRIDADVDGVHFTLQIAGSRSKNPGAIYVKANLPGRVPTYLGKITAGTFHPSYEYQERDSEAKAAFLKLNADPVAVIAASGLKSGRCCYCRKQLTDARSLKAGYGPVCAANWNLPWGEGEEKKADEGRARTPRGEQRSGKVTREQKDAATAEADCPKCGATAGHACTRRTGAKAPTFHLARFDAWKAQGQGRADRAPVEADGLTYNTQDAEGREYELFEED